MEYEQDSEYVELPIHRVKKKRVLTEKQKANWQKALEVRQKNIALRKKAKHEMSQLEKEQLNNDPDLKNREKRLKDILMTILSMDEQVKSSVDPRGLESETIRREKPKMSKMSKEELVIKRCIPDESCKTDNDDKKTDDQPSTLYKPFVNSKRMDNTKLKETTKPKGRNWFDDSDDDEADVNIFKD